MGMLWRLLTTTDKTSTVHCQRVEVDNNNNILRKQFIA